MKAALFLLSLFISVVTTVNAQEAAVPEEPKEIELIIRTDDIGFCHAINVAIEKVLNEGKVTSISVIVNTPWLDEAVSILKKHPNVSVGVHLCLNSEWNEYRWGPVSPVNEVPSLVDGFGKFFGSRADFMRHRPKPEEVEKELRAQIDLALRKGLPVSYVDYHMGTAMSTLEFQEIVEKLAVEYGIGISRYFGEEAVKSIYSVEPEQKVDRVVEFLGELQPGRHLLVVHTGLDTPEMAAMTDRNAFGLKNMSKHRQAETEMLCDPRLARVIAEKKIKLVGYGELRDRELDKMQRQFTSKPYMEVLGENTLFNPYTLYEAKTEEAKPAAKP